MTSCQVWLRSRAEHRMRGFNRFIWSAGRRSHQLDPNIGDGRVLLMMGFPLSRSYLPRFEKKKKK